MAQECIATLNDSKVFKDLKTKLGTDTEVIKAVASVFDGEKFNDDFNTVLNDIADEKQKRKSKTKKEEA